MREFAPIDRNASPFSDRRDQNSAPTPPGVERRQFGSSYDGLSPNAKELAKAIDEYKVRHRRRFVTYDEILQVVEELGYQR